MEEIWKDIEGFNGSYQISNLGRVKSFKKHYENRILKPTTNYKGYLKITLHIDVRSMKTLSIHRLVAQAFIPNPENKPQVNHINCIKTDNNITNLEWCNNSENQIHAFKNGLQTSNGGRKKRKVRCIETGKVFNMVNEAARFISKEKDCRSSIIRSCKYGKIKAYGYNWEYIND